MEKVKIVHVLLSLCSFCQAKGKGLNLLGYKPMCVENLTNEWTCDDSYRLHFKGGKKIFLRTFYGKFSRSQQITIAVLRAFEKQKSEFVILWSHKNHVAMTNLEGRALLSEDLNDSATVDILVNAIHFLTKALEAVPQQYLVGEASYYNCWNGHMEQFVEYMDSYPNVYQLCHDLVQKWHHKFSGALKKFGVRVIHGDLHYKNIIYNPSKGKMWIIDFENCHMGSPFEDWAFLTKLLPWSEENNQKWAKAILEKELTVEDSQLLYACQVLHRFWYACLFGYTFPKATDKQQVFEAIFASDPADIDDLLSMGQEELDHRLDASVEYRYRFLSAAFHEMKKIVL